MTSDTVELDIILPLSAGSSFTLFVDGIAQWWPKDYSWSLSKLENFVIEPFVGGKCYEIGPAGFRLDWGTVVQVEPGHQLSFLWHINPNRVPEPDPKLCSCVHVQFISILDNETLVHLVHEGFSRHGSGAQAYCDALAADVGWPFILEQFRQTAVAIGDSTA